LKAKQRKKNDFNRQKLKALEAKKHSLIDRNKAKKDPKLRKHVKEGMKLNFADVISLKRFVEPLNPRLAKVTTQNIPYNYL